MRHGFRAFLARFVPAMALAISVVPAGLPAGAAADTFTFHFSDVTETVHITSPCFGPAVGTLTYDGVLHVTDTTNGYHLNLNIHGEAVVEPADPNEPAFSGQFSESQVLNLNRENTVATFVVTQQSNNGMKFHITFQFGLNPTGTELVVFNVACRS